MLCSSKFYYILREEVCRKWISCNCHHLATIYFGRNYRQAKLDFFFNSLHCTGITQVSNVNRDTWSTGLDYLTKMSSIVENQDWTAKLPHGTFLRKLWTIHILGMRKQLITRQLGTSSKILTKLLSNHHHQRSLRHLDIFCLSQNLFSVISNE